MTSKDTKKTTAKKSTQTVKKVREIVKTIYSDAHKAKEEGKTIAYCMVGCQYDEILRAMDIVPVWTENYAGLSAAKRDAEQYLVKAEADGYSNLICGYVRAGLGFDALRAELGEIPPDSPDGGMTMPDMLLGCSTMCDPRFKWYQALGHYMEVPTFSFDVLWPAVDADYKKSYEFYVQYQLEQFKELIAFLEDNSGEKMDYDRLSEIISLADETYRVWWDCYQLRKAIPSPMPSEDHFNAFVPAFFKLGTEEALGFYKELYAEVKERVDNKIGAIPDEKFRLLWGGGLPPWHTMWMFNYFENLGGVFVIENAYRPWDPIEISKSVTDPLERLARRTLGRLTDRYDKAQKRSGDAQVEVLLDLVEDYSVDGIVMHASKSCRASTIGQVSLKTRLQDYVDVPTIQLISDIIDVRDYSETEWKMNIDAFAEAVFHSVEAKK